MRIERWAAKSDAGSFLTILEDYGMVAAAAEEPGASSSAGEHLPLRYYSARLCRHHRAARVYAVFQSTVAFWMRCRLVRKPGVLTLSSVRPIRLSSTTLLRTRTASLCKFLPGRSCSSITTELCPRTATNPWSSPLWTCPVSVDSFLSSLLGDLCLYLPPFGILQRRAVWRRRRQKCWVLSWRSRVPMSSFIIDRRSIANG